MIYHCPVCGQLYEMRGADHRNEPCRECHRAGWRQDSVGNLQRLAGDLAAFDAEPDLDVRRAMQERNPNLRGRW